MTSIEIRVRDLYEDLNVSEKKAATFFLNYVDSVFAMPIAQLAKQADTTQVAWVRLCKRIGFDGLKDMKKALFNELNEAKDTGVQRENTGFFTDIRDYNTVTEMAEAVKTSSICAIEDTIKLLDSASVRKRQAASSMRTPCGCSASVHRRWWRRICTINSSAWASPWYLRRICTFS